MNETFQTIALNFESAYISKMKILFGTSSSFLEKSKKKKIGKSVSKVYVVKKPVAFVDLLSV